MSTEAALLPAGPTEPLYAQPERLLPDTTVPRPATPPKQRKLGIPTYDFSAALRLERELGVSHVVAQILVRRGLGEPDDARAYLDPRERHDPAAFAGIERAVDVIERHTRAGTRITVHGDYDVDGVCATAVVVRALRALGATVDWFVPGRLEDGYGLSSETVQRLAARGTGLLLTVDCGITAVEEVAEAISLGIDVVLSDHHARRVDGRLPDCPIVHPGVCGYPCPDLCGTAVAFKLAQALGAGTADDDIELVALATVADLMPLRGENRRLVREGLAAMANTGKPGLRALMNVAGADPSALDAQALGFRLAPRLNAAGRVRRADAALELLLTEDPVRAAEVANELDAANGERRAVEQRIVWEAETLIAQDPDRSAFVLAARDWHPGVIGIVASRVVERHHRPAILVAIDGDGSGHGSGRSIPGFDLLGALHATAGYLERYGGHRAAAGLSLPADRIPAFAEAIDAYAASVLTPELLTPVERVDAIVSGSELGLTLADELASLEPCGIGNPGARLLVPGARFRDVRPMGEGRHARFSVISGGSRARAVAFGCDGRLGADVGAPCDGTFRLERNVWNGAVEPRLILRHVETCSPQRIEVVGEPVDYVAGALDELNAPLQPGVPAQPTRTVLDRRGQSPLSVVGDVVATGQPVLAVCADVPRRLAGLEARIGGFPLISYHALERAPAHADMAVHVVALDPPTGDAAAGLIRAGCGFTHLAWGAAELRFAEQMHELEYGLRTSLVTFYRSLRQRRRVAGEELGRLLRGDGPHGRPARLAGRLIRVLAELELVSLDRDLPALAIAGEAQTALERSSAYRAYAQRYEDGQRYLNSENPPPSG
jgi:single-stranded-DNA-specific exonuclease